MMVKVQWMFSFTRLGFIFFPRAHIYALFELIELIELFLAKMRLEFSSSKGQGWGVNWGQCWMPEGGALNSMIYHSGRVKARPLLDQGGVPGPPEFSFPGALCQKAYVFSVSFCQFIQKSPENRALGHFFEVSLVSLGAPQGGPASQ